MPGIVLPGSQVVNVQGPGGMNIADSLTRVVALQDQLQSSALERQVIQQRMGIEKAAADNEQLLAPIRQRFMAAQAANLEQQTQQSSQLFPEELKTRQLGNEQLQFNVGRQKTIADKQDRQMDDVHQAAQDAHNVSVLMTQGAEIENKNKQYHLDVLRPMLQQGILQAKAQTQALNLQNQQDMQKLQGMARLNRDKDLYEGLGRWQMMTPEGRAQLKSAHPGTILDYMDPNSSGDPDKDIMEAVTQSLRSPDKSVRESASNLIGLHIAKAFGVKDDPLAALAGSGESEIDKLQKNFTTIMDSLNKTTQSRNAKGESVPSPAAAGGKDGTEESVSETPKTGVDLVDRAEYHASQHPEAAATPINTIPKLVGLGAKRAKQFLDDDPSGAKVNSDATFQYSPKDQEPLEKMYGVTDEITKGPDGVSDRTKINSPEWNTIREAMVVDKGQAGGPGATLKQQVTYNGLLKDMLYTDLTTKSGRKKATEMLEKSKSRITKVQTQALQEMLDSFKE